MSNSSKKPLGRYILIRKIDEDYHIIRPLINRPGRNLEDWRDSGRKYDERAIAFFYYNERSKREIHFYDTTTRDKVILLAESRHSVPNSRSRKSLELVSQSAEKAMPPEEEALTGICWLLLMKKNIPS